MPNTSKEKHHKGPEADARISSENI